MYRYHVFAEIVRASATEQNRDTAGAAAAKAVWGLLARQAGDPREASGVLLHAAIPVYGLTWNRSIITSVGTRGIDEVLYKMRNSLFRKPEYGRLRDFTLGDYSSDGSIQPEFSEWRISADRFRCDTDFGRKTILGALTHLEIHGIITAAELGDVRPEDISAIRRESLESRAVHAL